MLYLSNHHNNHLKHELIVQQSHFQDLKIRFQFFLKKKDFLEFKPVPPTAIAVAIARFSSK